MLTIGNQAALGLEISKFYVNHAITESVCDLSESVVCMYVCVFVERMRFSEI